MSNSYPRSLPRKPSKKACENGLFDDGKNCLEKKACKRVPCPKNKSGCLECGSNVVKMDEKERSYCDVNEEKLGNLCYKKCKSGYYAKGSLCIKGIPNDIKQKIKSKIKVEQTGLIPSLVNFIKESSLRIMGKKKENFENTNEISFLTKFDNFLKNIVGRDLEEYRWVIFASVIIFIILLIDYTPKENVNANPTMPESIKPAINIKYRNINYIDNLELNEFLKDL